MSTGEAAILGQNQTAQREKREEREEDYGEAASGQGDASEQPPPPALNGRDQKQRVGDGGKKHWQARLLAARLMVGHVHEHLPGDGRLRREDG